MKVELTLELRHKGLTMKVCSGETTQESRLDTIAIDGSKVFALRKKHGMTQKSLADKVGVGRGYIGSIETVPNDVSRSVAKRLAETLQVELAEIAAPSNPRLRVLVDVNLLDDILIRIQELESMFKRLKVDAQPE